MPPSDFDHVCEMTALAEKADASIRSMLDEIRYLTRLVAEHRTELADLHRQCEWHKVEDGLPEVHRTLFITVGGDDLKSAVSIYPYRLDNHGTWVEAISGIPYVTHCDYRIIAWRYWPEPYQPRETDDV